MKDERCHAVIIALVHRERGDALMRFIERVRAGSLDRSSTAAALQDSLGVDHARAALFRAVFESCDGSDGPALADAVLLAARTVRHSAEAAPPVEVAWTYPGGAGIAIRTTGAVANEIIGRAEHSLWLVGYSVTVDPALSGLAAKTVAELAAAAHRGVAVTAILHREPANREALERGWPRDRRLPAMFTWPERDEDAMASLHAKVLVVDHSDALVTSANLTYHGFEGNVEIGVRVQGDAAGTLERLFQEMINRGEFVPWDD